MTMVLVCVDTMPAQSLLTQQEGRLLRQDCNHLFLSFVAVYVSTSDAHHRQHIGSRWEEAEREGEGRGDRERVWLMYICHALLRRMPALLSWL